MRKMFSILDCFPEPEPLCQRVALGLYGPAPVTRGPDCTLDYLILFFMTKFIGKFSIFDLPENFVVYIKYFIGF